MESLYIIKSLRMTEKAVKLAEIRKYTFEVHRSARAHEIADAVESTFNVKVSAVNTINIKGKLKRNRRQKTGRLVKCDHLKKAVVTLKDGFSINLI
jgi:large subunit ribosomal protein L23